MTRNEGDVVISIMNGKGDMKRRIMKRREAVNCDNGKPLLQVFSLFRFPQAKQQREELFHLKKQPTA